MTEKEVEKLGLVILSIENLRNEFDAKPEKSHVMRSICVSSLLMLQALSTLALYSMHPGMCS